MTIYCENGHKYESQNPAFNMAGGFCHLCDKGVHWGFLHPKELSAMRPEPCYCRYCGCERAKGESICLRCRDQFAMAVVNGAFGFREQIESPYLFACGAYELADAMMEARKPK